MIPCRTCDAKTHLWTPRRGGNDPDVVRTPCPRCGGTGTELCSDCCEAPAMRVFAERGRAWDLCDACYAQWRMDAAV